MNKFLVVSSGLINISNITEIEFRNFGNFSSEVRYKLVNNKGITEIYKVNPTCLDMKEEDFRSALYNALDKFMTNTSKSIFNVNDWVERDYNSADGLGCCE